MPARRRQGITPPPPAEVDKPLPRGRAADFDVANAIHEMPSSFIQCRDFNHSWRPFTARWDSSISSYEVQLKCQRCKTVRIRLVGGAGQLIGSKYDYADGYLIKGMGRITGNERDSLRLESIRRILPDDATED